jgi:hypothetical protein
MVDLNDTVRVVQVEMPDSLSIKEKELGVLFGAYHGDRNTAVQKGYGRCQLIKGNYFYFTIHHDSAATFQAGDLIYLFMVRTNIYYGLFPKLASHFIRLQDVYGNAFYDRYQVFREWSALDEDRLIDSIQKDIRVTGKYYLEKEPSMDLVVESGLYQGGKLLSLMAECNAGDVRRFLEYVIEHPRLYAGNEWKISEIFATWIKNGAPGA